MEDKQPDIENAGEHDLMSLCFEFAPEKPKNDGETPLSAAEPKEEVPPHSPRRSTLPAFLCRRDRRLYKTVGRQPKPPGEEGDRQ